METKPSLEYLAGFFDGEGTICIDRGNKTSYYLLTVSVGNTVRQTLEPFENLFGGSIAFIRRAKNHKDFYCWRVQAAKAEYFCTVMLPYLILKKPQAKLALEFREYFKGEFIIPRGNLINDHSAKITNIMELREDCYDEMAIMNKRGK